MIISNVIGCCIFVLRISIFKSVEPRGHDSVNYIVIYIMCVWERVCKEVWEPTPLILVCPPPIPPHLLPLNLKVHFFRKNGKMGTKMSSSINDLMLCSSLLPMISPLSLFESDEPSRWISVEFELPWCELRIISFHIAGH